MSALVVHGLANAVEDPELRYTNGNAAVANVRLAFNRSWKGDGEKWQEEVLFVAATFWNGMAEKVAREIKKGDPLHVGGILLMEKYKDKNDNNQTSYKIRVNSYAPIKKFPKEEGGGNGNERSGQQTNQPPAQERQSSGNEEVPF